MRNRLLLIFGLTLTLLSLNSTAETGANDPHAAHRKMMSNPATRVVSASYEIPDVDLTDSTGARVNLRTLMSENEPLIVNFIFTTCTTICPVITATTLQLQRELQSSEQKPRYVSISIDPDYDSATVLREYATRYGADWTFLTGESSDVMSTLRAFDAYRGNKVNHFALILMRPAKSTDWTRVEGLTSAHNLANVWRQASP